MKKVNLKRLFCVALVWGTLCLLGACSRLERIKNDIPPLPRPGQASAAPTADVFIQPAAPQFSDPGQQAPPNTEPVPVPTPAPTPFPTPVPTPVPTPEPPREDPNTPHLFIDNATYPEDMPQYSSVNLMGEIYTDKGVIAMVWGRILDADGEIVQNCKFYPYTNYFSLAGTVNAELLFGMLEPGHYAYVVSAVAENNSFTNGEEILIEQPFEVFYP